MYRKVCIQTISPSIHTFEPSWAKAHCHKTDQLVHVQEWSRPGHKWTASEPTAARLEDNKHNQHLTGCAIKWILITIMVSNNVQTHIIKLRLFILHTISAGGAVGAERVFSTSGTVFSCLLSSLKPDHINRLVFLAKKKTNKKTLRKLCQSCLSC